MSACAFCSAPARARGNGPDLCPACLERLVDLGSAALDAIGNEIGDDDPNGDMAHAFLEIDAAARTLFAGVCPECLPPAREREAP